MKADVKKLLSRFTTKGIKKGDLVITFEIHKVRGPFGNDPKDICVVNALTNHQTVRVMHIGPGQQGVFKLK